MHASREQERESVWDYLRPPRVERFSRQIRVVFNDTTVAETNREMRILETSHPFVYYIPPEDMQQQFLSRAEHQSCCEFKGLATYYTMKVEEKVATNAAWSYHNPSSGYESIKDHVAFYPGRVDACYVDGERVQAQKGDFYGRWITPDMEGLFKGGPGTAGWGEDCFEASGGNHNRKAVDQGNHTDYEEVAGNE